MKICVIGWYFNPEFFSIVEALPYPAFVVKHREGDCRSIPSELHENVGLDFGAFQQYLLNHWDGESPVLFIQDDTMIHDIRCFEHIEEMGAYGVQHAYIFRDEYEELCMGGAHGRAMYASADFLSELKSSGGFPYDATNLGENMGGKENDGLKAFISKLNGMGNMSMGMIAIVPGIQHGRRGVLSNCPYVFDRRDRVSTIRLDGGTELQMPLIAVR